MNPSNKVLKESLLDLTVAGTKNAVMMVESEAKELSEDIMLGAVNFGHQKMQLIINAIEELTDSDVNILDWTPPELDDKGYEDSTISMNQITDACTITKKQENEKLSLIKSEFLNQVW